MSSTKKYNILEEVNTITAILTHEAIWSLFDNRYFSIN
jgi:hypothetical protein